MDIKRFLSIAVLIVLFAISITKVFGAEAKIIARLENGQEKVYKNLNKIWEYVRDKGKFFNYVTNEIKDYLKE